MRWGVTAALVLLELVDGKPNGAQTGKDLFKGTLKRVDTWLRKAARAGHFEVDNREEQEAFTVLRPGADLLIHGGAWRRSLSLDPRYFTTSCGPLIQHSRPANKK
jgi:hypothetical protein